MEFSFFSLLIQMKLGYWVAVGHWWVGLVEDLRDVEMPQISLNDDNSLLWLSQKCSH
jgi:hypothetical protein